MLGKELLSIISARGEVIGTDIDDLDLRHRDRVQEAFARWRPDLVIHCAAMTKVDDCEDRPEEAYAVNALGTRNVALAASQTGARLIYVSTDFVFDGKKGSPYIEFDEPNPLSVYGRSKLAGERYAAQFCRRTVIVRTALLYGRHGWNFVDWVVSAAQKGERLRIVTDLFGSPTHAVELAKQLERIAESGTCGVFHCVGIGAVSRFEWAKAILEYAGLDDSLLDPITSEHLQQKALRPMNSSLDNLSLRLEGISLMRPWEEALKEYIQQQHN